MRKRDWVRPRMWLLSWRFSITASVSHRRVARVFFNMNVAILRWVESVLTDASRLPKVLLYDALSAIELAYRRFFNDWVLLTDSLHDSFVARAMICIFWSRLRSLLDALNDWVRVNLSIITRRAHQHNLHSCSFVLLRRLDLEGGLGFLRWNFRSKLLEQLHVP